MKIHVEITLPDDLSLDLDELAERAFPGNHYKRSIYVIKAVREKINRDKARHARAERAKK